MRKLLYICIMIIAAAGLVLTPACTIVDEAQGAAISTSQPGKSPSSEESQIPGTKDQSGVPDDPDSRTNPESGGKNSPGSEITSEDDEGDKEEINIITTDEELEEYFNSITDEEIEELFKIIEDIDISPDIGVDNDPGFDDILIP